MLDIYSTNEWWMCDTYDDKCSNLMNVWMIVFSCLSGQWDDSECDITGITHITGQLCIGRTGGRRHCGGRRAQSVSLATLTAPSWASCPATSSPFGTSGPHFVSLVTSGTTRVSKSLVLMCKWFGDPTPHSLSSKRIRTFYCSTIWSSTQVMAICSTKRMSSNVLS